MNINNPNSVEYDIYLYDIKGKLVTSLLNQTENTIKLMNNFSSGLYNLKIVSTDINKQKLIIVQ